ncbi:MAG TPA: S26 family signal peptidase [Terriglobales bacterium]|nr:S26 family signal peptidase [Terriglobales bacterium]
MTPFRRHRRFRRQRRRPGFVLGVSATALLAIAASLTPSPLLIWNVSASAPIGLYARVAGPPARGDLVLAWLPAGARELAAERTYLPRNVPVVKRVAALAGDIVCAEGAMVFLNGKPLATRRSVDSKERPLPSWEGCQVLQPGDVFLLMVDAPDSFDGRYFGAVGRRQIIGRLVPLWTK